MSHITILQFMMLDNPRPSAMSSARLAPIVSGPLDRIRSQQGRTTQQFIQ